jgi:choline monooxygenase
LRAAPANGSRFMRAYPMTMFALTIATLWSFQCLAMGPEQTRVIHTSMFPKSRVSRAGFEQLAANDYKRQDMMLTEDNDISVQTHLGLRSAMACSPAALRPRSASCMR